MISKISGPADLRAQAASVSTLGKLLDRKYTLTIDCEECRCFAGMDLRDLTRAFGRDRDIYVNPIAMACPACKSHNVRSRLVSPQPRLEWRR